MFIKQASSHLAPQALGGLFLHTIGFVPEFTGPKTQPKKAPPPQKPDRFDKTPRGDRGLKTITKEDGPSPPKALFHHTSSAVTVNLSSPAYNYAKHSFVALLFNLYTSDMSKESLETYFQKQPRHFQIEFDPITGVVLLINKMGIRMNHMIDQLHRAGPFNEGSILAGTRHQKTGGSGKPYDNVSGSQFLRYERDMARIPHTKIMSHHFAIEVLPPSKAPQNVKNQPDPPLQRTAMA